ncbi:hypothetical protein QQ008_24590 [Fulvivirgaceae bacterium BMA10]|uniref:Uncharacterized protein n=1 Tax=Splendidivirga corallicola TaxID=3051826 RepID=A0ABT8KWR5_9BACT|nr:hypothetical protein [Fulvivirgaceae bacterium BMA10]
MIETKAILSANSINKYGYKFTVGALFKTLIENSVIGVPSLLGHDSHRPIGWIYPLGLFVQPNLTRLAGVNYLAESNNDQEVINTLYQNALIRKHLEMCEDFIDELKELVKDSISTKAKYLYSGCVAYNDSNILYTVYPKLKELLDKDELIKLSDILNDFEYLGQGIFKDKSSDLTIYCHRYFRRNFSYQNNFYFFFLDQFVEQYSNKEIELKIALDTDMIGYAPTYTEQQELEYWWGPKYSDNIEEIPLGVAHYECDDIQKTFFSISGTQFWWKKEDSEYTLEAEEIRNDPSAGVSLEKYGCRYTHAIFDSKESIFNHFDCAIRMYDTESMLSRIDKPINQAGKNAEYTKLFRIDGKLELSKWKSIVTNFFQDNPLWYEYFGMKNEYEEKMNSLRSTGEVLSTNLTPYYHNKSNGIRIFTSFHKKIEDVYEVPRKFIHPNVFKSETGIIDIIEFDSVEIKKSLNKIGEDILIPDNLIFVKNTDSIINYPTIFHSNNNLQNNLNKTIEALSKLFAALLEKNDKLISCSLAWNYNEQKMIKIAFSGHLSNIIDWLSSFHNQMKTDANEIEKWIENCSTYLNSKYDDYQDQPDVFDLVKNDGTLYLKRISVPHNWLSKLEYTDKGLEYELTIPKNEGEELLNRIKEEEINIAYSYFVEKVTCSKSGEDYLTSTHSKVFDEEVVAIIEESNLASIFWTKN